MRSWISTDTSRRRSGVAVRATQFNNPSGASSSSSASSSCRRWLSLFSWNSPFVLTFTCVCCVVLLLDGFMDWWPMQRTHSWRAAYAQSSFMKTYFVAFDANVWADPWNAFRLVSYVVGHSSWTHFTLNAELLLLLGPQLESRFGSLRLARMVLITALATSLVNGILFDTGLIGASGIVFMFVVLTSFVGAEKGAIPVTFVLIGVLYLGREVRDAVTQDDDVSHFGHMLGGVCGGLFGYLDGRLQQQSRGRGGRMF